MSSPHPQRIIAAPQLRPAPKPAHAITSPGCTLPLFTASSRASGIEPAEVLLEPLESRGEQFDLPLRVRRRVHRRRVRAPRLLLAILWLLERMRHRNAVRL